MEDGGVKECSRVNASLLEDKQQANLRQILNWSNEERVSQIPANNFYCQWTQLVNTRERWSNKRHSL